METCQSKSNGKYGDHELTQNSMCLVLEVFLLSIRCTEVHTSKCLRKFQEEYCC
ncbi:hypothetical protein KC19_4G240900 [Ceratodon purpureus]|uniref:Uncharacterized protein n=1 Tax=Ceratodon purpureus TaxID=3225 RepID=A0A8T0IEE8_CERPU|nr:hypothetical protein KC19_4G240900 [Ceratodon purpureus]